MENNFTSNEHMRDSSGNAMIESAGRTIARMRERQRGKNFVFGVVITALALSTAITGIMLGAQTRYANDLRAKLDTANQQGQTGLSQQYGSTNSGTNGTTGTTGVTTNSGSMGGTTTGSTTDSSSYGSNSTNYSGSQSGTGTAYGRNGYQRNWRNFNNNNGIAPAYSPSSAGYGSGTGSYSGMGSSGSSYNSGSSTM